MREIIVLSKDRVGLLADVSQLLAEHGINIEYMSAHSIADKAAVHLVASDDKKAEKELRNAGFEVLSADTLVIKLANKVGELAKITRTLAEKGVSIEHLQILKSEPRWALISLKVDRPEEAEELLKIYLLN